MLDSSHNATLNALESKLDSTLLLQIALNAKRFDIAPLQHIDIITALLDIPPKRHIKRDNFNAITSIFAWICHAKDSAQLSKEG